MGAAHLGDDRLGDVTVDRPPLGPRHPVGHDDASRCRIEVTVIPPSGCRSSFPAATSWWTRVRETPSIAAATE
jgi:hypothetical protein